MLREVLERVTRLLEDSYVTPSLVMKNYIYSLAVACSVLKSTFGRA